MDQQPRGYEDVAFGLFVGVAAVAGVFWAGGAASAWTSGHRVPHGEPLAGLAALAHLGDPSKAWHSPVGPPEIYWACTVAALAVAGLVAFAGWRQIGWRPRPSVATGGEDGPFHTARNHRGADLQRLGRRDASRFNAEWSLSRRR